MTSYQKCKPFAGFFEDHYLRSLGEFIVALYLKHVEQKTFCVEAIRLTSANGQHHKVPDFCVYNHFGELCEIIEVKNTIRNTENVIVSYAGLSFGMNGIRHRFFTTTRNALNVIKKQIAESIGREELDRLIFAYKAQRGPVVGLRGPMNPMYGRKHRDTSKALMAAKAAKYSTANGMYGRSHTQEAKEAIGAKWKDQVHKLEMLKKGFFTHWSNLTKEQKASAHTYYADASAGIYHEKPGFVNRCYTINQTKAIQWFGSREAFLEYLDAT